MFKKDPQPKASSNIKSSERRRILQTICDDYGVPREKLDKETEYKILPATTKQATFKSIQKFSGTIYYNEQEVPLWFKTRDSGLYPSVYTVWECPFLVPRIRTHPHVIEVLNNGADLMLPGTIPPFPPAAKVGSVVGVVSSSNPSVIEAVGVSKMPLNTITRVLGTTGVAVEVLHHVDDELYKLNKYVDIDVPKEVDLTIPWPEEQPEREPELEQPEQAEDEDSEQEQPEQEDSEQEEQQQEAPEKQPEQQQPEKQPQNNNVNELANAVDELTVEDIDHFFIRSLLQSIKLDEIDIPITSSNFMSNHVYKNLPVLDSKYKNIKKTSWKKTGKFLRQMAKSEYLQVKGKDDDLTVTGLMSKQNKLIENFVPHKIETIKPKSNDSDKKNKNELKLIQLYQPTEKYRMLFNKLNRDYYELLTINEVKDLLNSYIKFADLVVEKNPKMVKVDDTLKKIIPESPVARSDIVQKFIKYFTKKFVIAKPDQNIEDCQLYTGELPKIRVVCETKIGRKTITRVANYEKFYIKPHVLNDDLRTLCSGSTTYEETREGTEVIVQGPHFKAINDYLIGKGVPGNRIDFEDKSKKKKKRR